MDRRDGFVKLNGDEYYKISNYQDMPPFFVNLATNSDIWIYLSSAGALTAGRRDADRALFPYETDDRIHLNTSTGPKTVIRAEIGEKTHLWEPFDHSLVNPYDFTRNIYKNVSGTALRYEEVNRTLGLTFCYEWTSSERFGIVRTAYITSDGAAQLDIVDGVLNIIPFGITSELAQGSSCLTDAYKVAELCDGGVAVFSLSSKINDVPEPVEILSANIAWSISDVPCDILLSAAQLSAFAAGRDFVPETRALGRKCAYLTRQRRSLAAGETQSWTLVLDACLSQKQIAQLQHELANGTVNADVVRADIERSKTQLCALIAASDGCQATGDEMASRHHFINVLYNDMRGGVFDDGYNFDFDELVSFVRKWNAPLLTKHAAMFDDVRHNPNVIYLKQRAAECGDKDIVRICYEFLPLCFSRRHGDPSRPWNRFSINVKGDNGKRVYYYEGNWRDIFQNWEAMCLSYPEYLDNIIVKFLNASTADGYNPYRISTDGVDWEVPEPHNPFSGYGYWGDHQIIYLLRLLEALKAHNPSALNALMCGDFFTYANVPYRLKSYAELLRDPKNTLEFDYPEHDATMKLAAEIGADGKLIRSGDSAYTVSFAEKLLVPVLAKIANLVLDGGIWMNANRPEWNDANNAIVGNGLSMVTVYQLRRHLKLCLDLFGAQPGSVELSAEVADFAQKIGSILAKFEPALVAPVVDGATRKALLDALGLAYEQYRNALYNGGFSGKSSVAYTDLVKFYSQSLKYIDHSIDASRRADGLYESYNILHIKDNTLEVAPLFAMLEGQTAVLGSGKLDAEQTLELVRVMEESGLYCDEHKTFYLYPVKDMPTFMHKNILPADFAARSKLFAVLGGEGTLFDTDVNGNVRFKPHITDRRQLIAALAALASDPQYAELVASEREAVLDAYERVFKHKEFTGRSGIMYKYEGIGSIYWHQNAKFILSVQETFLDAAERDSDRLAELKDTYYRLREGLGFCKAPSLWGAFPLDPYSHTPMGQGAQQPGMTGQVKEEILTRRLELGIKVDGARITFNPALLRRSEFLSEAATFNYFGLDGESKHLELSPDSLAFTLCGTPVVYKLSDRDSGLELSPELSRRVFLRDRTTGAITVEIDRSRIV